MVLYQKVNKDLTHKAPPLISSRRQFQVCRFFKNTNMQWYFMRIVCWQIAFDPYFFWKLGKILQNLSSAAVLIGALRVKQVLWHAVMTNVKCSFVLACFAETCFGTIELQWSCMIYLRIMWYIKHLTNFCMLDNVNMLLLLSHRLR